jgi:hypothetical protein
VPFPILDVSLNHEAPTSIFFTVAKHPGTKYLKAFYGPFRALDASTRPREAKWAGAQYFD